jgi:hypothetical protein
MTDETEEKALWDFFLNFLSADNEDNEYILCEAE